MSPRRFVLGDGGRAEKKALVIRVITEAWTTEDVSCLDNAGRFSDNLFRFENQQM